MPKSISQPNDLHEEVIGWPQLSLHEASERLEADDWTVLAFTLPTDADLVDATSKFLVSAVAALFPAWLKEAKGIDTAAGAGAAAVRALARQAAASEDLFGPFLEEISTAALRNGRDASVSGFAPQTVLRESRKLLERSYDSGSISLVLAIADGSPLSAQQEQDAIWVAGVAPFRFVIAGSAASELKRMRVEQGTDREAAHRGETVSYVTPLSGQPAPLSDSETRLEALLSRCDWAGGRRWNHLLTPGPLEPLLRVDLLFEAERCIVEIDGAEHASLRRYAADRRRDRVLQGMGYAVLRFTNDEVLGDVQRTGAELEAFLLRRAEHMGKERMHG